VEEVHQAVDTLAADILAAEVQLEDINFLNQIT